MYFIIQHLYYLGKQMLQSFIRSKTISVNTLLLLVSLYIISIDNLSLWSAFWGSLGQQPWQHILFLISFVLLLLTLTLIILMLLSALLTTRLAAILLLVMSSIIAYHIDQLHVLFSPSMLQNIFQTNPREAADLMSWQMVLTILLAGVLPALLVGFLRIEKRSLSGSVISRLKLLSVMLLITTLSIMWTSKDYAFVFRENRDMRYLVNPLFPMVSLYKYVRDNTLQAPKTLEPVFADAHRIQPVSEQRKKDLLVIIVGETARAENFSLNGYARLTNPLLAQKDIVNFSNTHSCATATAESVPCMFSDLDRQHFKSNAARSRENLLDAFRHAGLSVLWRDNNSSCKGVCARVEHETLLDLDVSEHCNEDGCLDDILLYKLDEYLAGLQQDGVIVLHQMGSHGPAYYKRYPEQFEQFKPACEKNSVHNCNHQEIINAYDNTLLYNDYFIASVIDYLQARTDNFNSAMIYISDHGESLGENGVYLHGLPYFMAPEQQTHIPFMVWLSESMQQTRLIDKQCLTSRSDQIYSHDNLIHSALGLMNVSAAAYHPEMDIFNPCRGSNMVEKRMPALSVNPDAAG